MTPLIDELLAAELLDEIATEDLAELRELRLQCAAVESDVSMVRRLTQGRLDIVVHEARRRTGEDVAGLLYDLPDILSDTSRTAGPGARPDVRVDLPGEVGTILMDELGRIASPTVLSGLQHLDREDLDDLFGRISRFEQSLSKNRRALHERIDRIQAEIGRRYRDGEASVESVLGT